jgi:hypothetical protein
VTLTAQPELDRRPTRVRLEPAPVGSFDQTARWILAVCSAGAAVVHFAYSPAHMAEYWLYGLFFIASAWLQLAWAVTVVIQPRRWVLACGALLNLGVIGVWALSRTVGVWVGPNATIKEAATFPDVLCTAFEAVVVVGALALLARPAVLGRPLRARWMTPVAAGTVLALVAAGAGYALTPQYASAHDHGSGTAGHAHAVGALTGDTPCEKAGPPASVGQVLDGTGHFHRGPTPQLAIDETTRLQLQAQQEQARAVAAKYPTVADAQRAGYRESTVYVPCIGAHYTDVALAGSFDPAAPSELLYDGTLPSSHIVGLSYLVRHPGGPPVGFAGPNDVWHQHTFNGGLCINVAGLVIGSETTSAAQCTAMGGFKVPLTDIWMLHDWVVPGFECSWGVFAAECPELGGRVGGTAYDPPDPRQQPIPVG